MKKVIVVMVASILAVSCSSITKPKEITILCAGVIPIQSLGYLEGDKVIDSEAPVVVHVPDTCVIVEVTPGDSRLAPAKDPSTEV